MLAFQWRGSTSDGEGIGLSTDTRESRRLMRTGQCRPSCRGALASLLVAVLLAALFTACQSAPTRTATDGGLLQGHWEGYGPGGDCSVTIEGNALSFRARPDFWYETTFTIPAGDGLQQLHATILKDSSPGQADIGRVVVALFKIEDGTLTLGVIEDFDKPPAGPIMTDWDRAMDQFVFESVEP